MSPPAELKATKKCITACHNFLSHCMITHVLVYELYGCTACYLE